MKSTTRLKKIIILCAALGASLTLFAAEKPAKSAKPSKTAKADKTAAVRGESKKEEVKRTEIMIENARSTRYEKDKDTGHDVIVLTGDVKVSVSSGTKKNIINADTVHYDRVSEMLYADGNVSLEQTDGEAGGQKVTALSLMFNTSTLEGVFDDGRVVHTKSDALNLPSGATLVVASDMFGRSQSNTIAFKRGSLTFSDAEDPFWHINASRIWLLPGGEFAFLNALLFVGVVPVMYLPAFYYPKDELIFNPVFGYRKREGYFMQTTAYVYGRKPLETPQKTTDKKKESDNSEKLKALFNFVRPSTLKDQKLEGLVLHNLDTDFKGETKNYVKIMGDYYSNLGVMVGLDGVYKPKKYITEVELGAQLGFSNTVFKNKNDYLPYLQSGDKVQDKSNLVGFELPFRYSGRFKFGVNKPFSMTLAVPVYSDPYFSDDFSNRAETMDWISYVTENSGSDADDKKRTVKEISSFTWNLTSSYSASLPSIVKPYLSTLSMNLNSSLVFSSRLANGLTNDKVGAAELAAWQTYTPERKFYYPSQITPVTYSANISGTLISIPFEAPKKTAKPVSFSPAIIAPDELLTESQKEARRKEEEAAAKKKAGALEKEDAAENKTAENALSETDKALEREAFPDLTFPSASQIAISGITFAAKYSVKPSLTTQLVYSSDHLKKPEDFEWDNMRSSMYTLKVPVTLDNVFTYGGNFFSATNAYAFEPVFQKHPYISTDEATGGYSEKSAAALRKTDFAAEKKDLTNTNTVAFKPFCYINAIKDTGVTWRSTVKIVRTEFTGTADDPEWDYHIAQWDDEKAVTINALDFIMAANQLDGKITESLTLTTMLPPQPDQYSGVLKLGAPFVTLSFESGIKKTSTKDDAEWKKLPFKQNATLSFFSNSLKFTENYTYNLEDEYHDSLKLSLAWKGLQADYNMNYTYGYDFDETKGWVARKDAAGKEIKEFLPYNFAFSYKPSTRNIVTWKNRISLGLGVSTSVVADLLRPTDSYFLFDPSISLKIHEFLTFTFSSSSRNSVIYRYFGNKYNLPGEVNPFIDLLNSFRFDDEMLRKNAGFKLKSLNFAITHDLRDWDFNMEFKISPQLKNEGGKKYFDFDPHMTISIVWRPMAAMKTEIVDEYGEWKLNP